MPSVDILDAFAELVVRVVFSLPHTDPVQTSSSDDDAPYCANNTTQVFSRSNTLDEDELQFPGHLFQQHWQILSTSNGTGTGLTPASVHIGGHGASNSTPLAASHSTSPSTGSSAVSLDLYPGGIWNAIARAPGAAGGRPSRHSSVASMGTGDNVSTPRSGGNGQGFWARILGSSGFVQTSPHSPSLGTYVNTGVTTNASSFVQLTEEELGMTAATSNAAATMAYGSLGGAWAGFSTPPLRRTRDSRLQLDSNEENSRGAVTTLATAPSTNSTPLYEPCQLPSSHLQRVLTETSSHRQARAQDNQAGATAATPSSSSTGTVSATTAVRKVNDNNASQFSSTSEFVIL